MEWIERLSTIGYQNVELLGEGLSSWVFKGTLKTAAPMGLATHVLKVGRTQDRIQEMELYFRKISNFRSRHCPAVFGWQVLEGHPVLIMDFIDGRRLSDMASHGLLDLDLIDEVVAQLQEAILEMHECGIQHGDLHPENILIDQKGRIQLIDFGHVRTGETVEGSPPYMAAEVWTSGHSEPGSDWFALGLVYEDLLSWNHLGVRTVLELKERAMARIDSESRWFHPEPQQRGPVIELKSLECRRERLASFVQLVQAGWDPICGTRAHVSGLGKAVKRAAGLLSALSISLCLACLPVTQPKGLGKVVSTAEILVRTNHWVWLSVNGGASAFSPVHIRYLKPGIQHVKWTSATGSGEFRMALAGGQKKFLSDMDFSKKKSKKKSW